MSTDTSEDSEDPEDPEDSEEESEEEEISLKDVKDKLSELNDRDVPGRIDRGLPVSVKDWSTMQDIREDFEPYFTKEKESGCRMTDGVKQLSEYIDKELTGLPSYEKESPSQQPEENERTSKRIKISDLLEDPKEEEEENSKEKNSVPDSSNPPSEGSGQKILGDIANWFSDS